MSSRTTRSQVTKTSPINDSTNVSAALVGKKRSRPQAAAQPQKRSKTTKSTSDTSASHIENGEAENTSEPKPTEEDEDDVNATAQSASSGPANEPTSSQKITLTESTGDIFSAPPQALLIHSCNTEGTWNAGIASAFKSNYPAAQSIYTAHCKKWGPSLLSSALLIKPQTTASTPAAEKQKSHFIGCLFTSVKKGKGKGSVQSILDATGPAMEDLMRQVAEAHDGVGELRLCKINSGLFRVPWAKTRAVIEGLELEQGQGREIKVITREEE